MREDHATQFRESAREFPFQYLPPMALALLKELCRKFVDTPIDFIRVPQP